MIQIRPSQLSDLDRLMEIFDHARKFMASVGMEISGSMATHNVS